mmetsp:Transcript_6828/g.27951  ORF Transcript_6828/g.27951 Transcript_6828/m.27951 type:complete len:368 (-) Transcript_6828:60-1163(-)
MEAPPCLVSQRRGGGSRASSACAGLNVLAVCRMRRSSSMWGRYTPEQEGMRSWRARSEEPRSRDLVTVQQLGQRATPSWRSAGRGAPGPSAGSRRLTLAVTAASILKADRSAAHTAAYSASECGFKWTPPRCRRLPAHTRAACRTSSHSSNVQSAAAREGRRLGPGSCRPWSRALEAAASAWFAMSYATCGTTSPLSTATSRATTSSSRGPQRSPFSKRRNPRPRNATRARRAPMASRSFGDGCTRRPAAPLDPMRGARPTRRFATASSRPSTERRATPGRRIGRLLSVASTSRTAASSWLEPGACIVRLLARNAGRSWDGTSSAEVGIPLLAWRTASLALENRTGSCLLDSLRGRRHDISARPRPP